MTTNYAEFKSQTVGELAAELPNSIRVFEAWKIDYCCGGRTPLPDACANVGKTVEDFVVALIKATSAGAGSVRDWNADSLTTVAANIVSMYHEWTREELRTIAPIAAKVLNVHGSGRPELAEVASIVDELNKDLLPHMLKEEQVLFPYVASLERSIAAREAVPTPFFGTVKNPVRMMMLEHDRVGDLLARLRVVTSSYTPPDGACFSYRELYRRVADFEKRTHEHIHVENNVYFPRAVGLEDRVGQPAEFGADGCGLAGCKH